MKSHFIAFFSHYIVLQLLQNQGKKVSLTSNREVWLVRKHAAIAGVAIRERYLQNEHGQNLNITVLWVCFSGFFLKQVQTRSGARCWGSALRDAIQATNGGMPSSWRPTPEWTFVFLLLVGIQNLFFISITQDLLIRFVLSACFLVKVKVRQDVTIAECVVQLAKTSEFVGAEARKIKTTQHLPFVYQVLCWEAGDA